MDNAFTDLHYDSPRVPLAGVVRDFPVVARPRLAFGQLMSMHSPRQNTLLAALPNVEYDSLRPHLELVHLPLGSTLYEVGDHLRFACFPIAGIVSSLCLLENGAGTAVAIAGNEGMVGTSIFMGGGATRNRTLVQSAGYAYRLVASRLRDEFARASVLRQLLLSYTQSIFMQAAQTAMCNRHHSIEQQLCRWLLMSLDRTPTNELRLTHELLSNILGVRREGVSQAAGKLQKAGAIRYRRGRVTVLSRSALNERVCECYAAAKAEISLSRGKSRRYAGARV